MKKWIVVLLLLGVASNSKAQMFNEWFRQKKTQIKYLVDQIAALQVYIEYAEKGYKIAQQGLTTIGTIKQGDYNLHSDFFNALKAVNPNIRNSVQVADIIALQVQIVQTQHNALIKVRESNYLTVQESNYLVQVYTSLLNQSIDNIAELTTLLTAGQYGLSDDQRLKRIGLLYEDINDKNQFIQWFSGQTDVLMASRSKELQETGVLKSLIQEKE